MAKVTKDLDTLWGVGLLHDLQQQVIEQLDRELTLATVARDFAIAQIELETEQLNAIELKLKQAQNRLLDNFTQRDDSQLRANVELLNHEKFIVAKNIERSQAGFVRAIKRLARAQNLRK